jgi:phosphoenolpyruvate carboxykinase (ATP)
MSKTFYNLTQQALLDRAIAQKEGKLLDKKSIVTETERKGRSPKDKFFVQDAHSNQGVHWGEVNRPMAPEVFEALWQKSEAHLADTDHYASDLHAGDHSEHYVPVRVVTTHAWHQLFATYTLVPKDPFNPKDETVWTMHHAPELRLDPSVDGTHSEGVVVIDFSGKRVLILGIDYAGEIKKSMFTVLNYLLPQQDILPMHCAANQALKGDHVALFFGLSGTGKTTLSSDPQRLLIGDDEHGWAADGVFNFEGGCYAKCINLREDKEPEIVHAIGQGAILENVIIDPTTGRPDYADVSRTENTRAAYPRGNMRSFIPENRAGNPKTVIMLCCDLYGVLPAVSLLSKEQAAYYFLSGYTAKVGSTEIGAQKDIQPTFSTCFGAAFFPRDPLAYARLLMKRLEETGAQAYLVNTGWTGGAYGAGGERFDINVTRSIVHAILSGAVLDAPKQLIDGFNMVAPTTLEDVEPALLVPELAWQDQQAYAPNKQALIKAFVENFERYGACPDEIKQAGPIFYAEKPE